jgi:hypothetical protein
MESEVKKLITAVLLALIASCVPSGAYAGGVMFIAPSYTVTLLDEPCTFESILNQVPAEAHRLLKQALLVWQGNPLEACWFKHPDGTPYVVDQEGDAGALLPQFGRFEQLLEASDR